MNYILSRRALGKGLGVVALLGGATALAGHFWRNSNKLAVPPASDNWLTNVSRAHDNIAAKRYHAAAENFGALVDETFTRVTTTMQAWLKLRDSHRGFFPRRLEDERIWNYKDCAADLYCHLVIASSLIAPGNLPALRDVLEKERAITSGLPEAIDLKSGRPLGDSLYWRIFGAVEYAKDGLLPILERIGPTEWLGRLHEVVDAIIAASPVQTQFGKLPAAGTEKNGEFLQVLSRLYQRDKRPEYLAAGRAIADAYLREVLVNNKGIPAAEWDFAGHRPRTSEQVAVDRGPTKSGRPHDLRLQLRDHGNEIMAGLSEWLVAESVAPDSRREIYDPVVQEMMDKILLRGRDSDGMWASFLSEEGAVPTISPGRPLNDNWGYLSSAYVAYSMFLPAQNSRHKHYRDEATRSFKAAIKHKSANWSSGMDGYADSLEGAQYLLPFIDVQGAPRWLDDEMGKLLAFQRPDGFVIRTYLDGNYVRTGMLYGLYRTQGTRVEPWRPGVELGAVKSDNSVYLAISSKSPWTGKLVFDSVRHRDNLGLPFEYPRLNGWPEWFVVEPNAKYEVRSAKAGAEPATTIVLGSELISGLKIDLAGETLHLTVTRS